MIARAKKYPLEYLFSQDNIGDVNFDHSLSVIDVFMISGFGYVPTLPSDFNQDGSVGISDVVT